MKILENNEWSIKKNIQVKLGKKFIYGDKEYREWLEMQMVRISEDEMKILEAIEKGSKSSFKRSNSNR